MASNDKQRFSLRHSGRHLEIRANQGHSMALEVSMQQQGLSYVLIAARCEAGGHHALLRVLAQ